MPVELLDREVAERHDQHRVSRRGETGRRPVDADDPAARLALEHVGLESAATVDVADQDLLVHAETGGVEQVGVDRDRPDVVGIALGHGGAVDLAEENLAKHVVSRFLSGIAAGRILGPDPLDPRTVAPERLEIVVEPLRGFEQMDHHVDEVGDDPAGGRVAVGPERRIAALLAEVLERLGHRPHLPVARSRGDHDEVADLAEAGDVEHEDVGALHVGTGPGALDGERPDLVRFFAGHACRHDGITVRRCRRCTARP